MGGKNKNRRIRWKPVEIENVFDISSSTTSEDAFDLHDEEIGDESYNRTTGVSSNHRYYSRNNSEHRNNRQHYYHRQHRFNSHPADGGGYYNGVKHGNFANYGSQAHSKSYDRTASANYRLNGIPPIPATGVYVNGLWIPASEVERIIVKGELPPPPYGPAIPPAIGQKNVYFYYGYVKRENNESECHREDSTSCQGEESAARGDGNDAANFSQTNEEYIPVIYASSHAPPSRRPFRNTRIRRRRFLDNDYVDLESDNCDIITKVTPKNYHFILSLDKASGSEPSDSATPPASSEDLEQDSSTDTFNAQTTSATPDEAEFEFGTVSEIAKDNLYVAEFGNQTAEAMIEEFAQRAVSGIIEDALQQVRIDERKKEEELNKPGCSGITSTELYAEKVARTIMGGVIAESNKRRPPPIVIEDSINANPGLTSGNDDEQNRIRQHADQMASTILDSVLHPADSQATTGKDENVAPDQAKETPTSRLAGVREVFKQGVRESGNFLGEGATSPDSGEASPRAPQQTTATISQTPSPLPPEQLSPTQLFPMQREQVEMTQTVQQLPVLQSQEVPTEFYPESDRCRSGFPRVLDWVSLSAPKNNKDSSWQLDNCGQRKYVRIEDASKAMWSALHNRSYRCIYQ